MMASARIMFDKRQAVVLDKPETQTFRPAPRMVNEIRTLFAEGPPDTAKGCGTTVRRALKPYEARLPMTADRAA